VFPLHLFILAGHKQFVVLTVDPVAPCATVEVALLGQLGQTRKQIDEVVVALGRHPRRHIGAGQLRWNHLVDEHPQVLVGQQLRHRLGVDLVQLDQSKRDAVTFEQCARELLPGGLDQGPHQTLYLGLQVRSFDVERLDVAFIQFEELVQAELLHVAQVQQVFAG